LNPDGNRANLDVAATAVPAGTGIAASSPMPSPFRWASTAFVCALFACGHDSPTSPSGAASPGASIQFRVVTWNVQHGYTPNNQHVNAEQIAFIAGLKPDVVALQEVAEWDNDMPGMYHQGLEAATGRRWTWRYEADLPGAPASRRDGNVLGTALPVVGQDVQRLDDPSAPNDNNRNRSVIRFSISQGGVRVDLATTHLDYLDASNRRSQVDRMQAFLDRGVPSRIVAGDFNAEPGDAMTWSGWRSEYGDAWLSPVNGQDGAPGFTMPLRSTTGRPGRIDYQWYVNAQPTHVELVETGLSDHYALVVDWTVTAK
jgi:endonuclease/exonuclease/phosphatase family metal-dependent hydrolase